MPRYPTDDGRGIRDVEDADTAPRVTTPSPNAAAAMSAAQPPPAQVKNALGALKKQRSENRSHRRSLSGGTLDLSPEALAAPMKAMHVGGSRGASPSPASSPSTSPTGTTMTAHEKLKAA